MRLLNPWKSRTGQCFINQLKKNTINGLQIEMYYLQKIKWYDTYKKTDQWLTASLEKLNKYGTDVSINDGIFECNSVGWHIFLTSNDRKRIKCGHKIYVQCGEK